MDSRRLGFDGDRISEFLALLERMAAGETQERLPISSTHDELDALAHGINVLIGELGWTTARVLDAQAERAAMAERVHVANAVRESEARFRLIANTAPVLIWMSDATQQWTYVNQHWLLFTGQPLEAMLGNGWTEPLHPDDTTRAVETYRRSFEHREPFQAEYRLRRHDGEFRWVATVGVPRFDPDGSFGGYIGSALDITDRKLAAEALSTVSQRLIEAQEEERARLARELHDDITQRLGLLVIRLDIVMKDESASLTRLRETIDDTRDELDSLVSDVDALSHRLHPPRLDLLSLDASAAALCREIADQHGIEIRFHAESVSPALAPRISLSLYRVLQEALQNTIKHSGVQTVEVVLRGSLDFIELTVRDGGSGFDPGNATRSAGIGLTSMQERMKAVDGQLCIDSVPGQGTTIYARAPLFETP